LDQGVDGVDNLVGVKNGVGEDSDADGGNGVDGGVGPAMKVNWFLIL
jgi:hypothetical protein